MFKKLKQKRCRSCIWNYRSKTMNYCDRPYETCLGRHVIHPLKLICFHYKKGAKNE